MQKSLMLPLGTKPATFQSRKLYRETVTLKELPMELVLFTPLFAAAGWSLIYLLMGGGLVGAVIIFFVLKAVGA
jgi:hypothetical protein